LRPALIASFDTAHYPHEGRVAFAAGQAAGSREVSSTLQVKILDPLSDSEWDRCAISHPESQFFHSAAWAKVLCRTYQHKPVYLHFSRGPELVALLPFMEIRSALTGRRGVCLPFSDFCVPLVFNPSESAAVMDKVSELAREQRWKYFEIRGGRESLPAAATPAMQFYSHKLALPDREEELLARFGSATRRAIRKAEKSGVKVEVVTTQAAMLEFYRLHVGTRRRHGLPPQPRSFFLNIYEEIIKPGQGFVVLGRTGSQLVAAAVFFRYGNTAVYKFGASDEIFQGIRANNLVMWEAIKYLMQNGCKMLHLGRSSLNNPGLRRFKAGWGVVEGMIEYFRFDTKANAWKVASDSSSGFHNKIFRRLPLVLNRLAGAAIYPHLD
jgi:lipid II:glycine glycyltransferase (peptidoglycan interpeptide bridge formation enzyme)